MGASGSGLPDPVVRFLTSAFPDGVADVETARLEGRGRFRRRPLPWLPVRFRIFLRPGRDRVQDLEVVLGPVTLLRVLDAFVDGRGITRVLGSADTGAHIDQGSLHPLLAETLFFPSAWSIVGGLSWEPVDDRSARLVVPFQDGSEVATVRFDPTTNMPSDYEAVRYKSQGPKVDWQVRMRNWQRLGTTPVPRTIEVRWADEPGPWLALEFHRLATGVDIDEALRRARRALAAARG